jgi:quercetin dioxygenase-like cupin family protein
MNTKELHPEGKKVSAIPLFKGEEGVTTSIHLSQGAELSKHQSKTPALLICIAGEVVFENGNAVTKALKQGDYISIEPNVDHWINGVADSYLLLIK